MTDPGVVDWTALFIVVLISFLTGAAVTLALVKWWTNKLLRDHDKSLYSEAREPIYYGPDNHAEWCRDSTHSGACVDIILEHWGGADNGEDWGKTTDKGDRGLLG